MSIAYKASFGSYQVNNKPKDGERLLLGLTTELGMDGIGGYCRAELSAADYKPLNIGDVVKVELDSGEGMHTVFTGKVSDMEITASTQKILALDAVSMLAGQQLEVAYEKVKLDFIIKDFISKAGAQAGEICKGPEVGAYAVHATPHLLIQLAKVAEACGADVYCKGDGKVYVLTPEQKGAEHSFEFSRNVRALNLTAQQLSHDSVEVWGEGSGSSQGKEKSHWLSADITGVCGKASLDDKGQVKADKIGKKVWRIYDGALRTGEAAKQSAKARMTWLAARRIGGSMTVHGVAAVMPGDSVKLDKLPKEHGAAELLKNYTLRVRRVRHELSREQGLVTHLAF